MKKITIKRREHITQQEVFQAAKSIASRGKEPTLAEVRFALGDRGSQTTVHKYLSRWKTLLFKKAGEVWEIGNEEEGSSAPNESSHERAILKETIARQAQQIEVLSSDLLNAERTAAALQANHQELQHQREILQTVYAELSQEHEALKATFERIALEREKSIIALLEDKNHLVEKLRQELRETHEENLKQTREWSYEQDEALMQEKIKNLNFQEQIKTLKEELKQAMIEVEKTKNTVEPLRREIARLNIAALLERGAVQEKPRDER